MLATLLKRSREVQFLRDTPRLTEESAFHASQEDVLQLYDVLWKRFVGFSPTNSDANNRYFTKQFLTTWIGPDENRQWSEGNHQLHILRMNLWKDCCFPKRREWKTMEVEKPCFIFDSTLFVLQVQDTHFSSLQLDQL